MRRSLLVSGAFHVLATLMVVALGMIEPHRPELPPVYSVDLVSAAEPEPPRRPQPVEEQAVEEEPEAKEKIPEPNAPEPEPDPAPVEVPAPEPDEGPALPVTLEGRPFEFPWYLEALVLKVQRNWKPQEGALKATIYFRIDRSGKIHEIDVAETSGSFVFDLAARGAVEASDPMPPLPAEYSGDYLGVYFDFDTTVRPSS